jgi:hypothetical protein
MSAISQTSDGVLPQGSFDITILEDGQDYVADNFSLDENATRLKSKSARGRNSRNKVVIDDATFSADFQFAEEDTDAPRPRHTFAVDADRDGNIEPYMIEKAGRTFGSDSEWKCKVSGFACANPLIYIPATSRAPVDRSSVEDVAISSVQLGAYLPRDATITASSYTATGLPTGIVCSTTGEITGTPTTVGAYSVTLKVVATRVVDGATETLTGVRKYTWTITATP